ncbi:MAG: hypothetical protein KAR39_11785 [Thermoplasmata archaeon]|nr:hypothetical protein [Thermoplasmata archaeon]
MLVDAKAFLNTTISDGVLFFTAGQIELMRNLMQYANRRSTWVSDYYIGYYLSPDDTDWDLIQERVADLEETLMGNVNILWGYEDTLRVKVVEPDAIAGTNILETGAVPEGKVWLVNLVRGWNATSQSSSTNIGVYSDGSNYPLDDLVTPPSGSDVRFTGHLPLKEGDKIRFTSWGTTLNDDLYLIVVGSIMDVPA